MTMRVPAVTVVLTGLLIMAGCGSGAAPPRSEQPHGSATQATTTVQITAPKHGAADVPTPAEIALTHANPATGVVLTDANGATVEGATRPDASSRVQTPSGSAASLTSAIR